jgi:LPXTG-site transpeptidase (sortase) family protein
MGAAFVLVAGALWAVATLFPGGGSPALSSLGADEGDMPVEQPDPADEAAGEAEGRYRIWIPRISLTAQVVEIDSDDERVLHPPEDPMLAGWWRQGAAPGSEAGSVLLAGHAVESGEAVFNDVSKLSSGDMILLNDSALLSYRVSSVEVIDRDLLPDRAEELFAQDGPPRLVLITCEDWDGEDFRSNVVVVAEPV